MRKYYALMILFVSVLSIYAQKNLQFHHINTKGYSVRAVYRDINGIVWLGTSSGILSLPQLESRNPEGYQRLSSDISMSVNKVTGDSEGGLWIKTIDNDVYYYHPQRNEFVKDVPAMFVRRDIKVWKDFDVNADKEGHTLVTKDNNLFWLDQKTGKVTHLSIGTGEHIIAVCHNESYYALISNKSLYILSIKEKRVSHQVPLPPEYRAHKLVNMDEAGNVWVWSDNKVWKYHHVLHEWTMVVQIPSNIVGFQLDGEQQLWIATDSDGIYLCDVDGHVLAHLLHSPWDANSLQSNKIDMLFYDKERQTMWISYAKGGLSICTSHQDNYSLNNIVDVVTQESVSDILTFAPSPHGEGMWIGMENRGVYFHHGNTDKNMVGNGSATALHTSKDGSLWIGLYHQGLLHRQPNGSVTHFFKQRSPYDVVENEKGEVFIALLGEGVWWLNPVTGDTVNTHLKPSYALDLAYHKHRLYAATTEGLFTTDKGFVWEKVCDGRFRYLCIDKDDYTWILGNEGCEGLTLLDANGSEVKVFADLKNAPLKNISVDKDGNIWMVTPTELLMLRHQAENKSQFDRYSFNINPDGKQLYYNFRASEIDANGILWLGTTTGYQQVDTRKLLSQVNQQEESHQLLLGAVSVNDKLLTPQTLGKDIVFIHELSLSYNENNLVIECSNPNDEGFSADAYYYQLKGFSDTWYPIEGRTIVLSNLPSGDYQLLTRTQFSQPSLLLAIHIAPPFWLSWWAFLLYLLIVTLAVWGVVRYYHHRRVYKQRIHELQLQQEQQEQMNEMKLRFFTNISHDLRTPLSLIISPVEELSKQVKDPQQLSTLQMIRRSADHLLSLVNQILDFRRLESGREKLVSSYGDIITLLRDICNAFQLKADKEHIQFSFQSYVEHVDTFFDKDKMTKIMMNLLSNAFKFTEAGGSVTVGVDIADRQVVVTVADTGVGIPDADKERIFDRFFQSESGNRMSMGSGIGLHIVREYVRLQGGDITVSDQPEGTGSVFRFTIPLRKNDGKPKMVEEVSSIDSLQDSAGGLSSEKEGLPTLLLVEDNQDFLAYMRQSLERDYHILTAVNGVEALDVLSKKDVDMITSDVMMPEMDGLELCHRVKTDINTSHIPVILLTAKSMTGDELEGLEAGADDYITKPFSMDILRQRIHKLVERNQKQHERFAKEVDIEPSEITVTSLDEQFIAQAISIVEAHIGDPNFGVEELSNEMGVHRSQLYKKLYHLTGKTPVLFVRLLRLKRGKQLLEQSGMYVSEVAYQVGFNSPRLFSKYFKEEFGVTPKEMTK
ncbi:MAG: response regulator [Prevotella sp.]|nr:response regulator [Prevotella sp.]